MSIKQFIYIIFFALVPFFTFGQDITGTWNGLITVQGVKLTLVFHIQEAENGYSATMDSPDQGAKGIPVTSLSFENSALKLSITNIEFLYEGKLSADGQTITGNVAQYGLNMALDLAKGDAPQKLRPQEPVKPYPYDEEEVVFENPYAEGVKLAGTLTLPKKEGIFPAVILISGSGVQNRDGASILRHKPFLVIADYLTRNGIAVLRYDDRGFFPSTGNHATATTYDFSTDAEAALKYLQTRKEINPKKIGLIGHSEGGVIAPMLASRSKDVAFIVMLAGTGLPGNDILLMQNKLLIQSSGADEKTIQKTIADSKYMLDLVVKSTNTEQLTAGLKEYLTKQEAPPAEIQAKIGYLTQPWMQYFLKYDPIPALEKVKCPVLALIGEKDMQVPAKANLEAISKALSKGRNKKATVKELPGLNHLFQTCETGLPIEYAEIEETISPVALSEMLLFIKKF